MCYFTLLGFHHPLLSIVVDEGGGGVGGVSLSGLFIESPHILQLIHSTLLASLSLLPPLPPPHRLQVTPSHGLNCDVYDRALGGVRVAVRHYAYLYPKVVREELLPFSPSSFSFHFFRWLF